jgi:hypothetical protein
MKVKPKENYVLMRAVMCAKIKSIDTYNDEQKKMLDKLERKLFYRHMKQVEKQNKRKGKEK